MKKSRKFDAITEETLQSLLSNNGRLDSDAFAKLPFIRNNFNGNAIPIGFRIIKHNNDDKNTGAISDNNSKLKNQQTHRENNRNNGHEVSNRNQENPTRQTISIQAVNKNNLSSTKNRFGLSVDHQSTDLDNSLNSGPRSYLPRKETAVTSDGKERNQIGNKVIPGTTTETESKKTANNLLSSTGSREPKRKFKNEGTAGIPGFSRGIKIQNGNFIYGNAKPDGIVSSLSRDITQPQRAATKIKPSPVQSSNHFQAGEGDRSTSSRLVVQRNRFAKYRREAKFEYYTGTNSKSCNI